MNNPAIKTKGLSELWKRIRFLLVAFAVYRLCTHIPIPGIDPSRIEEILGQNQGTLLGVFNLFSGGALSRMSVMTLGILPYISAAIVIQLLTAVVPSLERLKKEGQAGQRKIQQYIRYSTFGLATLQAIGMCVGLVGQGGLVLNPGLEFYLTAVVSIVGSCMFLMWLGEQITEHGIGNGISMIVFAGIVAEMPSAIWQFIEQARTGQIHGLLLFLVGLLALVIIYGIVHVERAQRRLPINHAGQQRQGYTQQHSHLPLKINQAGVIPAIFASSILLFPASMAQWFGQGSDGQSREWLQEVVLAIGPGQPLNLILFSALIIFFCFFYTALMFNPKEVAGNLKRSNAYITGLRPGEQTASYVDSVMTRLTVVGALYMTIVCLLPQILVVSWNVPFYLGGTSLLIVVVVAMDFISQVQTHLINHQYGSLMRKVNIRSRR